MYETYSVVYRHKISGPPVTKENEYPGVTVFEIKIRGGAFTDRRTLARALRETGVLGKGQQIASFRTEGDKTIVFPKDSVWHAITLTHAS